MYLVVLKISNFIRHVYLSVYLV